MKDIEMVLSDKFNYIGVSKDSQYMLLSKSKGTVLYDFEAKAKLCDIKSNYVESSVFTDDNKFIVLQKPYSFDIFSMSDGAITARLMTGQSNTTPGIVREKTLYYIYSGKKGKTVRSYNIETREKQCLYSLGDTAAALLAVRRDELLIFCRDANIIKLNLSTNVFSSTYLNVGSVLGITPFAYSEAADRVYFVKDDDPPTLYSYDIESRQAERLHTLPQKYSKIAMIQACSDMIFIASQLFSVLAIDISDGTEHEIPSFPLAVIHINANGEYLSIYNGEYTSFYRIVK